jgi:membrane protease YdiL (CAAX protease family)
MLKKDEMISSSWLTTILVFCVFSILGAIKLLAKGMLIRKTMELPKERRAKLLQFSRATVIIFKILLWSIPLCLLVIRLLPSDYRPQNSSDMTALLILVYIIILEEFLYRKSLIKKLEESKDNSR